MKELDIPSSNNTFKTLDKLDYLPVLEDVIPVAENKLKQYQKKLRQYFLSAKKTTNGLKVHGAPVLLAPYLRGGTLEMNFPVLYENKNHQFTTRQSILQETFRHIFESEELDKLNQNLPTILSHVQDKLGYQDLNLNYDLFVNETVKTIQQIGVHFMDTEVFYKQCEEIKTDLLEKKVTLIGFSVLTPFQIFNLQLNQRKEDNQTFLNILKKCISGMNEILLLHRDENASSENHFDFAGELISFDKIEDIAPPVLSSSLPESRLDRLRQCHLTLSRAYKFYSDKCNIIFVTKKLAKEFGLEEILNHASLEISSENSCTKAYNYYKREIQEFVQIIAALRIAELEINQKYNEDLHAPYFEGFDISYLSDDDFQNFRSLIVVEESKQMMKEPKDFLALLSDNALVKVLAINRLDEINITVDIADKDETYLEIAALAIIRRNAFVFQGGADTPSKLNKAFHNGLNTTCPALWNILFPKSETKGGNIDFLTLITAIESRYFPRLEYNIKSGDDFGSHFDIRGNPQHGQSLPTFVQSIKSPSGKKNKEYSLTMADFLALSFHQLNLLEILPSEYSNEDLIPLAKYLTVPQETLEGKIPFIWMVDEQDTLKQAVISLSWLRRCRARLDYWHFIQELGGVNSSHLNRTIKKLKSEWEAEKKDEMEDLKAQLQTEFDHTRTNDLEQAIQRILNALLETDDEISALLKQSDTNSIASQEANIEESEPKMVETHEELIKTISSDAWVESNECTSCNDCIEALPSVFKYNSDKLAFVHNPKGGTYAKIVAIAEKCPARCIHPGLPQNGSEKGLEKMIKRAEKYN